MQVVGRQNVWALGDCAGVPNEATDGRVDPPTSQHALRQARQLVKNLIALREGMPLEHYRFRSLGQVATLGRKEGIADINGVRLRGLPGWLAARAVHLAQVPGASRRLGVVSDWALALFFPPNMVTYTGLLEAPSIESSSARPVARPLRLPAPGRAKERK